MIENLIKQFIPKALEKMPKIDAALADFINKHQVDFDDEFAIMLKRQDDKVYVIGITVDDNNVLKQRSIIFEDNKRKSILVSEFLGNLIKKAL